MGKFSGNIFVSAFVVRLIAAITIILVIVIGIGLGLSLAMTANIKNQENFVEFAPALPTKILDIHGTLVTEFASDEKRELVTLSELPRHLIHAVLAREDPDFYNHRGFSIRAITRAAVGQLLRKNWGGGSTITQQVAGTLYTNRSERTIKRKIRELWWAFQIERRYTKNEILEIYLNYMPMGPGTYGVETASKFFFGRSAREVTIAESAVLAVLLSGPTLFNPLRNPNQAQDRQRFVIDRMVQFGFVDKEEAEASFAEFWNNFDWTRPSVSAYHSREDKAPWFSEYVRRELDVLMYGTRDYYRDGYVVHTTLDLNHQEIAESYMAQGLERANRQYLISSGRSSVQAERIITPIVELLTLYFDLTDISATSSGQNEARAMSRYTRTINPLVDMAALAFGIPELKDITGHGFAQLRLATERNVVEGALISIENETGYITAIVGGSKYDESNQLIRASQANVQYGSAFKPLYYSAAIDTRKFTSSTLIYDVPVVFHNEDGIPYIPLNFRGEFRGSVLVYGALAHSMNVPSMKILDAIGFDAAIDRSSTLLDITDPAQVRRLFPRVYPLGLGITSSSPLRLARAYAVFGNQGRSVTPIAIRSIEDRNGRIVFDVERELRQRQRRMGNSIQVVSPQNAYIMTKIMEKTVEEGSLAGGAGWGSKFTFRDDNGTFRFPVAGKTGTPQNWSDAWAVGYSPYYTTAVWFGFDKPGNSLGVELTGATLAGPIWGDYMRDIHRGLPRKSFTRPSSGIIEVVVCAKSGLLRTAACNEGEVYLPFLEGTHPNQYCELHGGASPFATRSTISPPIFGNFDTDGFLDTLQMPQLELDLFPEFQDLTPPGRNQRNTGTQSRTPANRRNTTPPARGERNTQPIDNDPFIYDTFDDPPMQSVTEQALNQASLDQALPDGVSVPEDTRQESAGFPETVIQFVPPREDQFDEIEDTGNSDLPSWNPLE
ncbi:MAG: PBP1A family penicillin-binding protein [Treponema sp.]|jgi:penicillin-binding protein 1A|nr:PBP1A family penicillin-binding protein [Treponema sp.]